MAILFPRIIQAKQILRRSLSNGSSTTKSMDIPKGYLAIYVGEQEKKRYVVPVWLLSEPAFQELLDQAEQEFGYVHQMGGLTIPCSEYTFNDIASQLGAL
ncbi:unnamed protein product [Lactuca virosa]|uniref:Uncharacterized protein n=1 Tax=Lactuca virosa TaxID=75947 RepID=A0AAU9NF00_9ASTR|nr:unnamed protein product [Lactuca virosa]CAH1436457.1 unnamed protein product [Lactuca virosa]